MRLAEGPLGASAGRSCRARSLELQADPDRERAGRANQAMLGMRKLDIAALEAAADGR